MPVTYKYVRISKSTPPQRFHNGKFNYCGTSCVRIKYWVGSPMAGLHKNKITSKLFNKIYLKIKLVQVCEHLKRMLDTLIGFIILDCYSPLHTIVFLFLLCIKIWNENKNSYRKDNHYAHWLLPPELLDLWFVLWLGKQWLF